MGLTIVDSLDTMIIMGLDDGLFSARFLRKDISYFF